MTTPKLIAWDAHAETVAALAAAEERVALQDAELAAALADLQAVVKLQRRIGGYLSPTDQATLWAAKARLVEAGLPLDDEGPDRSTR